MKSIDIYLDDFKKKDEPISMCLGYFDGVHLGHQHLLDIASKNAKHKLGVLIFDKPVARFIDNNKSKEVLTSLTDKFRLISRFDLSYFFILHLTKEFLNKSPLEFILFLKDLGVKEIESAGIEFDPNYHQAVLTEKDENKPSNVILEVLQKGYIYKDKVIRPAMVKVNE